jgi:hypothetical protein
LLPSLAASLEQHLTQQKLVVKGHYASQTCEHQQLGKVAWQLLLLLFCWVGHVHDLTGM